jgi:hypothetical protein
MRGTTAKLLRREAKRLANGDIAGAAIWYKGTKRIWSRMSHLKRSEIAAILRKAQEK